MTRFDASEFITRHSSHGAGSDNLNYSTCAAAQTVRERFRAQHGPAATLPPRPVTSREVRKTLLAAETTRWKRF